jgi:hypothetical protein
LRARVEIEVDEAEIVAEALKPDDITWTRCYAEDGRLIIEAETDKTGAMLNALDDYILNIKAAVSLIKILNF